MSKSVKSSVGSISTAQLLGGSNGQRSLNARDSRNVSNRVASVVPVSKMGMAHTPPPPKSAAVRRNAAAPDIWQQRFNGLSKMIDDVDHAVTPENQGSRYRDFQPMKVLQGVITGFRNFAEGQFNYFHKQWQDHTPPPKGYAHEYALRIVINRLGEDLEVLERIAHQREDLNGPSSEELAGALKKADWMAYEALKPAIDCGILPQETSVLTYFQKSAEIRVVPYASVALIGIPYSCLDAPRDFMAIPHEAGHYVHWHGDAFTNPPDQRIADALQVTLKRPQLHLDAYALKWAEEAFADCYAAWVAGPLMAKDSQDLEIEWAPSNFLKDDAEHPLSAIRPYSHIDVLRRIGKNEWANALRAEWKKKLSDTLFSESEAEFMDPGTRECVGVSGARAELLKIPEEIDTLLRKLDCSGKNFWRDIFKDLDVNDFKKQNNNDFLKLYDLLAAAMDNLSDETPPTTCKPGTWQEFYDALVARDNAVKLSTRYKGSPHQDRDREWLLVLDGGGWATGPEGPPKRR